MLLPVSAGETAYCVVFFTLIFFPHVVLLQFVCVAQEDYWRILNHVEKNTHKVEEEGEIVMVKEHRELDRSGTRKGHIVIKVSETFSPCAPPSISPTIPSSIPSSINQYR